MNQDGTSYDKRFAIVAYGLLFLLLIRLYARRKAATPRGLLLGIFLAAGFSARFFIEFVKMRQAAYGQEMALSVGQLLSVPVVLLGIWLWWRAGRNPVPR